MSVKPEQAGWDSSPDCAGCTGWHLPNAIIFIINSSQNYKPTISRATIAARRNGRLKTCYYSTFRHCCTTRKNTLVGPLGTNWYDGAAAPGTGFHGPKSVGADWSVPALHEIVAPLAVFCTDSV